MNKAYEAHGERARRRQAAITREGQEIAPLPDVENPVRKEACRLDLRLFLLTYFPHLFPIPFSADHDLMIGKAQAAALYGDLFALAMPRGSGKTTIFECACIWAIFYGHGRFVAILGPEAGHSENVLEAVRTEIEGNDLLLADFPEMCYPVRCFEGVMQRKRFFNGERIRVVMTKRKIVLPPIPGEAATGCVVKCCGITGAGIRGMKEKLPSGETIRPDLAFIDDIQTEKSADSPRGCQVRTAIMRGAVLGLAGPRKKLAGLMAATVLRLGDVADKFVDPKVHPEWNGERVAAFKSWPKNMRSWEQYGQVMKLGKTEATAFYAENRAEMDEGAVVYWLDRYKDGELSAVQSLMNQFFEMGPAAFLAEFQNAPEDPLAQVDDVTVADILAKATGMQMGVVPIGAVHLVSFIDVHAKVLVWGVVALEGNFTGHVVAYGTYPKQRSPNWTVRDASPTLQEAEPGAGVEAAVLAGLDKLTTELLSKEWAREGGGVSRITRAMIDANWGELSNHVYDFCRRSHYASVLLPSHGRFYRKHSKPMNEWTPAPGEKIGDNWKLGRGDGRRAVQHVIFDANHWKAFCQKRWRTKIGDKGAWTIFGDKHQHGLFADHLVSEYSDEDGYWHLKPTRENHYLDDMVGCAVVGSIMGASITEQPPPKTVRAVPLAELMRRKPA